MFVYLVLFVISSAEYTVAQKTYSLNTCSTYEFTCGDGSCVELSSLCNGDFDCSDRRDELDCATNTSDRLGPVSANSSSQLTQGLDQHEEGTELRKDQWQCPDGPRIPIDSKCDGKEDCPGDGSDETYAFCRKNKCAPNKFRCTYGACVHGMAPCNGVIDCADKSDERLPRCRNETDEYQDQFLCSDGSAISAYFHCNGKIHCRDGSDETLRACVATRCAWDQFQCAYGACVDEDAECNGRPDCADGSDELDELCNKQLSTNSTNSNRKDQWQCQDGTVIPIGSKCDGKVDCPDRSDETHALCRKIECAPNKFRCTYGACVDGTAPCDDVIDCADQSDELLPRCQNDTEHFQGQFLCQDGNAIPAYFHCDGEIDCWDGSDEKLRACAAKTCASDQFQCEYGACVDKGSECNGKRDCFDGSDELEELCDQLSTNSSNSNSPTHSDNCTLPPYPEHGTYVSNQPNATPGQDFASLYLNVTCHQGYGVFGTFSVFCQDGVWSHSIPKCVRLCKLYNDPSVNYYCLVTDSTEDRRDCNSYEPSGSEVKPECNRPNYYSPDPLYLMRCIDGSWDYVAVCKPECGRVTPDGVTLIIDGRPTKRGELPWHVGIYRKTEPYMQICGGSLVSNSVVISAAHCFWNDVIKQQPASKYAVAIGKIYRPWNNDRDVDAQKSDVKEIKIPARFQGSGTNFQDDIAVIILKTAFEYRTFVRPVCLDFDLNFDGRQLQPGNLGKVAGWGLTAEDGEASEILKVVVLPYVDIKQCIRLSPLSFREYITSDKICSGYGNGTALCMGDSGGGLAFLEAERYFLRGIVSAAPNNNHLCNSNTLTTFTQIIKHENFIKKYLVSN